MIYPCKTIIFVLLVPFLHLLLHTCDIITVWPCNVSICVYPSAVIHIISFHYLLQRRTTNSAGFKNYSEVQILKNILYSPGACLSPKIWFCRYRKLKNSSQMNIFLFSQVMWFGNSCKIQNVTSKRNEFAKILVFKKLPWVFITYIVILLIIKQFFKKRSWAT